MRHFRALRLDTRTIHGGLAVAAILMIAALVLTASASSLLGEGRPPSSSAPVARQDSQIPSYLQDVMPILRQTCVQCHGAQQADKGLRLDSYQRMMAGDAFGTVVIPGDSSLSAIVSVVKYGTMPHEGARLTNAEIETISKWIDAGAPEN